MKNHAENVHQRLVPDTFLIMVNRPKQPLHGENYFWNQIFQRGLLKSLKKVNYMTRKKPAWWYVTKQFLSYSKNYISKFMQANSWHGRIQQHQVNHAINYSTSICPFESGKCGKEGKKLQKSEYLENEKSFLD